MALGARAHVFQADLADEAQCLALLPTVLAHFGRVDAVVNNASLFEHDDVASFGRATLDRHWRANTAPSIELARALHAAVSAPGHPTGHGCVVNLLDQKLWNPNPDHLSYTLSKDDDEFERAHRMTPLQRSSTPDDVAQAVRYLLSATAVTGTTLLVDGGQHLQAQPRDVMFMARESKSS